MISATSSPQPPAVGSDPWLFLALPPLMGLVLLAGYLVVEELRPGTFTAPRPVTIAEAIVVGNGPGAFEMIAEGADVNARAQVRSGMLDDLAYDVTPLEAALMAQRIEVVRLLLTTGADVRRSPLAACLASMGLPEALPMLGLEPVDAGGGDWHVCFASPGDRGAQGRH